MITSFVFSRDYKVAAQLAVHLGRKDQAFIYLRRAISNGWTLGEIKKNVLVRKLQSDSEWKIVENQYDSLRTLYQNSGNIEVRNTVKKFFKKDQRKALLALFTFSSKGQDKYAEKRFAPHSEKQVAELNKIISTYEYPGERLIHNGYWAAVILSHHNSISKKYALKDTLYPLLRPKLLKAVQSGAMSPYEFAMIDDWYIAVKSDRQNTHFGYLSSNLTSEQKRNVNILREEIGLSSIETIASLVDIQKQTGINFYLPFNLLKKVNITD